jgi:hypothetical protein
MLLLDSDTQESKPNHISTNLIEILRSILKDHLNHQRVLQPDQINTVRNALLGRIKVDRSHRDWNNVLKWADMLITLGQANDSMCANLFKVDAMINLKNYRQALELACTLAESECSTAAILTMFKAAILTQPPKAAVERVIGCLDRHLENLSLNQSEALSRIFHCCCLVNEMNDAMDLVQQQLLTILLLSAWIMLYRRCLGWRFQDDIANDFAAKGIAKVTFFCVVHTYLQQLICLSLRFASAGVAVTAAGVDQSSNIAMKSAIVLQSIDQLAKSKLQQSSDTVSSVHAGDQKIQVTLTVTCLREIVQQVTANLPNIVDSVVKDGYRQELLGSDVHLEQIGNTLWHFGCLLSRTDLYDISPDDECIAVLSRADVKSDVNDSAARCLLASELYETAAKTFALLSNGDRRTMTVNQIISYMLSSASRLNAESSHRSSDHDLARDIGHGYENDNQSLSPNLSIARSNLQLAQSLSQNLSGFEDAGLIQQYRNLLLILEFSVLCRSSPRLSVSTIEQFIDSSSPDFLDLSVDELIRCAEISSSEPGGTVQASRRLYTFALQVANRDSVNSPIIGSLYSKIIDLSPSRQAKIETIREVAQLLSSSQHPHAIFLASDIDRICSLAYNAGVTLASLEQYTLASDVIALALQIASYSSSTFLSEWHARMQVSFV